MFWVQSCNDSGAVHTSTVGTPSVGTFNLTKLQMCILHKVPVARFDGLGALKLSRLQYFRALKSFSHIGGF